MEFICPDTGLIIRSTGSDKANDAVIKLAQNALDKAYPPSEECVSNDQKCESCDFLKKSQNAPKTDKGE